MKKEDYQKIANYLNYVKVEGTAIQVNKILSEINNLQQMCLDMTKEGENGQRTKDKRAS